jgi:antirestriction protein ArdC
MHQTKSDKAAELHAQLEQDFAELVSGEQWAAMLATASRFHNYSAGNVMLILRQCPTATRVAGYRTWQSVGRQVRKGERGIAILAPCVYRRRDVDETTGEETEHRGVSGFRVAHVFDVGQTDGQEIADVAPALLEGEAPAGLWDALAEQVAAAGFTLERGQCDGANGRTNYSTRTVTVRDDVDDAQACKTLAHELGHVLLHEHELTAFGCRGRLEVEAESVAYVVSQACGMATTSYSLPYVARWADGDVKVVKATAERVIRTAHAILAGIDAGEAAELQEVAA